MESHKTNEAHKSTIKDLEEKISQLRGKDEDQTRKIESLEEELWDGRLKDYYPRQSKAEKELSPAEKSRTELLEVEVKALRELVKVYL